MKLKYILLGLAALLFVVQESAAIDLKIKKKLLSLAKSDSMPGKATLIEYDDRLYLVVMASAVIEEKSAEAILAAREASQILAQKQFTEFIHGTDIKSQKIFTLTVEREKTHENNVLTEQKVRKRKKYVTKIESFSKGALKNLKSLGKWKNKTKTKYFYAGAILVP
tara:strand:+ start:222 stop:719 length:498 start_codon:yes stop_codon:yes gene_type:complete